MSSKQFLFIRYSLTFLRPSLFGNYTANFYLKQCSCNFYRSLHTYRTLEPWNNTLEFSKFLVNSTVYNRDGLLVLNKPYGATFSRDGVSSPNKELNKTDPEDLVFKKLTAQNQSKKTKRPYITSGCVSDSLNLVESLPYLKNHFGYEKLYISRVPEKHCSGVAILTTSEELASKVNKSHLCVPTGKDKYIAMVVGVPKHKSGKIKLGFKLEEDPQKGKRVVLLREWSNNAFKRGEVRVGTFHFKTICSGYNNLTSLVEIRVDLRKYHAYRVFCSDYLLAPILGDNLFGSRVQTVMGVPFSVNHFSAVADSPQKLCNEIYNLLDLNPTESSIIPVHIHLEEMLLPRLLEGKKDVVLKASPPTYFQWACEKLGLVGSQLSRVAMN